MLQLNKKRLFSCDFALKSPKMSKNRKISSEEFDYLVNLKPFVTKKRKNDYISFKNNLISSIMAVFGDKWYNLSNNTRQAIDYICFLSIERGFVYASPDHIAEEHNISKSTVYGALKLLREEGILYKANRHSRKQNGLGCPIHFFICHPYFKHINEYLNLGLEVNWKADWKAEKLENACLTKDLSESEVPTFNLPKQEYKDIHTNVSNVIQIIKYVPNELNKLYAGIFQSRLRNIWVKITQAAKTIKHQLVNRSLLIEVGENVCRRLFQLVKQKDMTLDQMCAFTYKTARDMIYDYIAKEYMQDFDPEENQLLGEAVSMIPKYEQIYMTLSDLPKDPESMKMQVMLCVKEGYKMLSPESIKKISANYERYSSFRHRFSSIAVNS